MKNRSSVRLVCFDLGGVLIRICRTWPEGCRAAGIDVRAEWAAGFPETPRWREIGVQFGTGQIDGETWAKHASEAIDQLYSPEEITTIHNAWMLGEYEGVCDVIEHIHDAGVSTAALSNTNADHWRSIVEYPSVARLHRRFASHLLRLHKPDPAIYREMERQVQIPGREILFFDDLQENVAAAKQVGWNAVQIDHRARTDQQIAAALCEFGVLQSDACSTSS